MGWRGFSEERLFPAFLWVPVAGKQGGNAARRAAASLIPTNLVVVLLREMKKKKQQNNSENSELSEEKQKEAEAESQAPAAPNSHKAAPAPQPIKRGQKVGRDQGDPGLSCWHGNMDRNPQFPRHPRLPGGFRLVVVSGWWWWGLTWISLEPVPCFYW